MGKWWKGPWRVDRDVLNDRWTVVEGDGSTIASFDVEGDFEDPINLANAELCAAAPDLAEALAAVHALVSEAALTGFNCHDGDWADRLFRSQQATHAALKKAKGEA